MQHFQHCTHKKLLVFQTGLDELNTQFGELKAKLDVIENAPKFTLEEVMNKVNEAVKLSSDQLKTSFAVELNDIKKLSENVKVPNGEPVAATIENVVNTTKEPVQKQVRAFGQNRTVIA